MLTHAKTINGHSMQVAAEGEGFAAWTCLTCDPYYAMIVMFGVQVWDTTSPITAAAQYAVDHSLTPA